MLLEELSIFKKMEDKWYREMDNSLKNCSDLPGDKNFTESDFLVISKILTSDNAAQDH